ncbi:5-formyltetrahydrofolate cyclo-ligase [Streptomyces sp. NPDC127036]|uniref:5-formyltetrahydrofolate cyclo-ligase n=1 Tax=Streptomyces sp. NPDC127036 TaxID=3347112 RepID=UPI003654A0BF
MASPKPFYLLDPETLGISPEEAAEKKGAAQVAAQVGVDEVRSIDIAVCGSVAVNRSGARIGKGAGYSDLEVALLIEAGLVTEKTVIVAPVHQLQVIQDEIPETEHDFSVDYIVTPDEVIPCSTSPPERVGLGGPDAGEDRGNPGADAASAVVAVAARFNCPAADDLYRNRCDNQG